MKINELLTEKEIKNIESYYGIINLNQLEMELEKHVLEMEISDFILYQISTNIEIMKNTIEQIKEYM